MFKVPLLPRKLTAAARDLEHPDASVRLEAARDLRAPAPAEERDARVEVLTRALADSAPAVRKEVLLGLADLEAREVLPRVLELFCDSDLGVRAMAVLAAGELATLEDHDVTDRMRALLSARDPALRYQALTAYVRLDVERRELALVDALSDEDAEIRLLALRLFDEHVFDERAPLPARFRPLLDAALRDSSADVRLLAELLSLEAGSAVEGHEVAQVVNRRRRVREPRDEQWSVELAGRLGLAAALPGLRSRAFGALGLTLDPFRYQARVGLALQGDERARRLVERALERGSRDDRTLVVFAIGRLRARTYRAALDRLEPSLVDEEVLDEAKARLGPEPA